MSGGWRVQAGDPEDGSALEKWLIENGLPRFSDHYSALDNLPVLLNVLFAVLAFELGMAPWLDLPGGWLVLAPGAVAAVTLTAHILWRRIVDPRPVDARARAGWLVVFYLGWFALWYAAVEIFPALSPDMVLDGAAVFLLLRASFLLAYGDGATSAAPPAHPRTLVTVVVGAIAWLAVEDMFVPDWDAALPYGQSGVSAALGTVILGLVQPGRDGPPARPVGRVVGHVLPVLPFLVLVLGADAALLPYLRIGGWQVVLPLVACAVAAVYCLGRGRRAHRGTPRPVRRGISRRSLVMWIALYLVAFPVVTWRVGTTVDLGHFSLSGPGAAGFALGLNLLYLVVATTLAGLAVERIGGWAVGQAVAHRTEIRKGLVAHLPLVIVFALFFLFTAETWEIVVETEPGREWEFWLLTGGLVVGGVLFLLLDAHHAIARARTFTVDELEAALSDASTTRAGLTALPGVSATLTMDAPPAGAQEVRLRLSVLRWLNAALIIGVYQALIFVPLWALSAVTFKLLAEAAVAPDVAATWIAGDDPGALDGATLSARDGLDDPWWRVSLFLTAFAVLERAVRIVTEPEQRAAVLGPADTALRVRFAVALLRDGRNAEPAPPSPPHLPHVGTGTAGLSPRPPSASRAAPVDAGPAHAAAAEP